MSAYISNLTNTIDQHCLYALRQFKKIVSSHFFFHFAFITILLFESLAFVSLIALSPKSNYIALFLALGVLTLFTYFIFIYYFQERRPQQFLLLRNHFVNACTKALPEELDDYTRHMSIANASFKFVTLLAQKQSTWQSLSKWQLFKAFNSKFHWKDMHLMQEMLMFVAVKEHIALIKQNPADLEAHTSLANAFIALGKLYKHPKTIGIFKRDWDYEMQQKFEMVTKQAIEELVILDHLAPNDPWVHAQLASCYRDLDMTEKEINEYEILNTLRPDDREILYRLGLLYFETMQQAKALDIYQRLRIVDTNRANELITNYDIGIKELFT